MRKWLPLVLMAGLPGLVCAGRPLFDSHLHWDTDHPVTAGALINLLTHEDITGAAITSRPPTRVLDVHALAPTRIAPILGVYEGDTTKQNWLSDPDVPVRLARRLTDARWRAVGELHLFADQRLSPVFHAVVDTTVERGLPLLLHADPAVIDTVFALHPRAVVIWAHGGAYPYPDLLADYLMRYPNLHIDLSVRDDRIAPGGQLRDDWHWLLTEFDDRFTVGVDTYRPARWSDYGKVADRIRRWLGQLPVVTAGNIAEHNARRLLGRLNADSQAPGGLPTPTTAP